jgi:hypothetical protein
MATSDVDICNGALILLGQAPITSLDDNSDAARTMTQLYTTTLRAKLREAVWNFTQLRASLVEVSATPAWGPAHQFQLPQDPYCLRIIETNLDEDEPWRIESYVTDSAKYRVIVTDAANVSILYIGLVTDVTLWDDAFALAMEQELAFRACYALTRNGELTNALREEKKEQWARAKSLNQQEGRALKKILSDSLTIVR